MKHLEEADIVLVPMRIDDDGDYFIKLSDTSQKRPIRHWIKITLHDPDHLCSPVLSEKQSENTVYTDTTRTTV